VVTRFALDLLISLHVARYPDEPDQVFTDPPFGFVEVLQASGIVSVQLGIPIGAALAVLRAHAFAEGCSLAATATQVLDHRLQLRPLLD
jgi:hypothetical protein